MQIEYFSLPPIEWFSTQSRTGLLTLKKSAPATNDVQVMPTETGAGASVVRGEVEEGRERPKVAAQAPTLTESETERRGRGSARECERRRSDREQGAHRAAPTGARRCEWHRACLVCHNSTEVEKGENKTSYQVERIRKC